MKIYDDVIQEIISLTDKGIFLPLSSPWKEGDKDELIFKNDTGRELGSGLGLSGMVMSSSGFISKDEVILIGKDIPDLKKDGPYARIVLLEADDSSFKEGNDLFRAIRRIDYTRYHVSLEGCMIGISSFVQKETLRISKKALKENISFSRIGKSFIDEYKANKEVKYVRIIFITEENFPYDELSSYLTKADNITKAMDHLVNKVNMDCHSCSLQIICNEVDAKMKKDFQK